MALLQKLASSIKAVFDPMSELEKKLYANRAERKEIIARAGDPEPRLADFRAQIAIIKEKLAVRASDVVSKNADISTVFANDSALLFMVPQIQDQFEKAFLAHYPKDWISEPERAAQLKKIDAEYKEISVALTRTYDELLEAGVDFLPAPEVHAGIFLGVEQ